MTENPAQGRGSPRSAVTVVPEVIDAIPVGRDMLLVEVAAVGWPTGRHSPPRADVPHSSMVTGRRCGHEDIAAPAAGTTADAPT